MENNKFTTAGFQYTKDQQKALNSMIDWSYKTDHFYILSGAAGTGKTTLIKEFIKSNKFNVGIVVTAPTHKAVRIASQKAGLNGSTIQKLLGLRPNMNIEDFDINNPKFDPRSRKAIMDHSLVIIDETSMINTGLYTMINTEALKYNVKVLFVGDEYQLPPIKDRNISPAFTKPKHKYNLTEIVRQSSDNPLLKLLDVVRDDVKNRTFNFIKFINKNSSAFNNTGKGYVSATRENFRDFMVNAFKSDFYSTDIDFCKFSAFTNNNVLAWNSFIRSEMYKEETAKKVIIRDDLITAYSTLLDEFQAQIIVNSEDYIIDDIQDYKNQSNIEGYIVRFRKVFGGQFTPYMFIVDTANEKNVLRFLGIANNLIREAKIASSSQRYRKWENYYKFKDSNLLIKSLFNDQGKLIVKKDLDYGYCLTIHKTQGSTYQHVFVNVRNIIYNKNGRPYPDQTLRNKLLYVAISRATDSATLLV